MSENRLRERLHSDEPSIGTGLLSTWPALIEVVGQSQHYDYIEFLGEYAPYDDYDLEHMARAAELYGLSTMIKVDGETRQYLAQRALAAGIQNVLFTNVTSPAELRDAIASVRPEPDGDNGIRMDRRIGYVGAYGSHQETHQGLVERGNETVIAVMIEKKEAVDCLAELLAVPGLDMVVFGPSDYSLSIERPGEVACPEIQAAEAEVIETAQQAGVVPRVEISHPREATAYQEEYDVEHFRLNVDLAILHDWWADKGEALTSQLREQ